MMNMLWVVIGHRYSSKLASPCVLASLADGLVVFVAFSLVVSSRSFSIRISFKACSFIFREMTLAISVDMPVSSWKSVSLSVKGPFRDRSVAKAMRAHSTVARHPVV